MRTQVIVDRYRQYGLGHNPFAFDVDQQQEVFVSRSLPSPPPAGSGVMVQVIGEKGAGKTTQLQQWRRESPGPYFYVPASPWRDRFARPPIADLVYADEVDRMPQPLRLLWFRQLARAGATVIVGTHCDLAAVAHRWGLDVVTHHLGPVDFATLRLVVDQRLLAARAGDAPPLTIDDHELRQIHSVSKGSIRSAEHQLHELIAERVL